MILFTLPAFPLISMMILEGSPRRYTLMPVRLWAEIVTAFLSKTKLTSASGSCDGEGVGVLLATGVFVGDGEGAGVDDGEGFGDGVPGTVVFPDLILITELPSAIACVNVMVFGYEIRMMVSSCFEL